nr:DUF4157 domain-containing protein [Streptomyces sp. WZ.A104]
MLREAGHPRAQGQGQDRGEEQHQHSAGCGHHGDRAAPVQRAAVHDVLRAPGRPLDDATRSDMESRLGADFSDVRVHTDAAAKATAADMGARAYTSGSHVVIGEGGGDRHTLAHELTHVIQQRQGPVSGTDQGNGVSVSDPSDRFEREAEANARRALSRPGGASRAPDRHESASVQQAPALAAQESASVQQAPALAAHEPASVQQAPAPARHEAAPAHAAAIAVQRFHRPFAGDNAPADWAQTAREYIRSNYAGIVTQYTRVVLGMEAAAPVEQKAKVRVLRQMGAASQDNLPEILSRAVANGGAEVSDQELNAVVKYLNIMEEECATAAKVREDPDYANPLPGSVIGTEFTFTDDTLNGIAGGNPLRVDIGGLTGQADANARAAITYARNKMNAWTAHVQGTAPPNGFTMTVSDVTVKDQAGKRFTYSQGNTRWWWEITMDDACLETRTDPTSVSSMRDPHVRTIIKNHIFGGAQASGLRVDQSIAGGGGHISMDSASAFGGSVELFVQSMREWEDNWENWVAKFGAEPRETDVVNAPWTGSLPQDHLPAVRDLLDRILAEARSGRTHLPQAIGELQAHMVNLPLHANAPQHLREKVDAHPEDRLHYQAVNLEHMGEDTETAHRRIEFRDIQAQANYEQLLDDLQYIGFLLQGVRDNVGGEQEARLGERHPRK